MVPTTWMPANHSAGLPSIGILTKKPTLSGVAASAKSFHDPPLRASHCPFKLTRTHTFQQLRVA